MFKRSTLLRLFNWYPPYWGAGVRVRRIAADFREIDVEMKLRWWNRNYVGTHFGGSLYSMIDPFYMLMVLENLGRDYVVWDKAATIRFKRPGRGTVYARFRLDAEVLETIRAEVDREGRAQPVFTVQITDAAGEVVAEAEKVLSVKTKAAARAQSVS